MTFATNRIRKTRYERTRLPRIEDSLFGLAGFYTLPSREESYGRATFAPLVPPRHLGDCHHLQRGAAHRRLHRVAPLVRRDPGRRLLLDRPDARDRPRLRQGPLLPAHLLRLGLPEELGHGPGRKRVDPDLRRGRALHPGPPAG